MNIFSCNQIHKTYKSSLKHKPKKALAGVSFQVKRHEVFGIIGLNGSGKSTILKIFMGFIKPNSGTALINNKTVLSKHCHQQIGYLPENPSLYKHLSITEHLKFGCSIAGLSATQTQHKIETVLDTVDLHDVAKNPIRSFSKGMTQRAALAYTILLEPKILILDEPMSGLDPLGRQLVLDIICDYQDRGATILFCSHILTDIERICDRIGIMHQGKLQSIITADALSSAHSSSDNKKNKTPLEDYFLNTVVK